ncbi:MAG: tripartite tricarboxylate transporter substrate binding protein [Actinomycetota bacterium]
MRHAEAILRRTLMVGVAVVLVGCGVDTEEEGGAGGFQPTENVVMVVPFEPGGGSDILGRAMAAGLEQSEPDATVSVENRPSASGAVGYTYLLEQQGNPHFLLASETTGVALPITTPDVPFEWTDFTPIAQIAEDAALLIVPADAPYDDLKDVIDDAKSRQITTGIVAATGLDAIVASLLEKDQGVEFERVVFESGGEEVAALLAGDVEMALLNPGEVIGQLQAGKVKALAAFADDRYEGGMLADVPTAKEQGVDVTFTQYRGLLAAGGIPEEARAFWEDALIEYTESPEYDKYIEDNYLKPVVREGGQFEDYLTRYESTLEDVFKKLEG